EIATDSFVAPATLSPESDVVLASKLKAGELALERDRASAELVGLEADLLAADKATNRLEELKKNSANALDWTSNDRIRQANAAKSSLARLSDQKAVILEMIEAQRDLTDKARGDLNAGVISRTEYAKEAQSLNQLELALLENERTTLLTKSAEEHASM